MTSLGIVTLTGYSNYGNRLQNFALQETLIQLGIDRVETLFSEPGPIRNRRRFARAWSRLTSDGLTETVLAGKRELSRLSGRQPVGVPHMGPGRVAAIENFVRTRIHQTSADYSDPKSGPDLAKDYDFFVVGSDQVWSPIGGVKDHLKFLGFASPKQRIAYAASVSAPSLPRYLKSDYRSGIAAMAHVSVRERKAAELVRQLIDREVPVVLDPTMLLERSTWARLVSVPRSLATEGYVATFLLGSSAGAEMEPVRRYARRADLKIVDLRSDSHEDLNEMGPLDFVGAIKGSKMVVTDSFHATVFCIILGVPFLLKARGNMNSRFDTLLEKSGMNFPKWSSPNEIDSSIDIDWKTVHNSLARQRESSWTFLATSLGYPSES